MKNSTDWERLSLIERGRNVLSLCNEMIYNDVNNSELAFFKTFFTFSMLLQLGVINFDF